VVTRFGSGINGQSKAIYPNDIRYSLRGLIFWVKENWYSANFNKNVRAMSVLATPLDHSVPK
jgi:hypothetical protein